MDDKNRYITGVANKGDVWYFPLGWQHSFQGIDPEVGCTTLIWFDDVDGAGSINLSDMMHAYPYDVVKASLNNIPEELTLAFPDLQILLPKARSKTPGFRRRTFHLISGLFSPLTRAPLPLLMGEQSMLCGRSNYSHP